MTGLKYIAKAFKNKTLFNQALTHKSWVNEHPGIRESNERLEFLGDAILEYVISQELFLKFPNNEEGFLTTLRSRLVDTDNLANIAKKMGLGKSIYLSNGEEATGGRDNESLLADTLEAIIGAIFIDQGLGKVSTFISENILITLSEKLKSPLKDAKSRLQEYIQAKGLPAPKYKVIQEDGPDHAKKFTIAVMIKKTSEITGFGKSKLAAQEAAAKRAIENLGLE